ncbi:major facilitator superfamily domain-containing protein [Massariosphaeria phaeospora]|uniref:Major facilitator superfamily domain-containing protein n=1 Tax=Massariosphaeria phaeospora TaxID=100035 RepID=A0A7C8MZ05_9PLEO|nr:major facilitator superfamily domain-containing protein [Massariosphaeria phaeospora]
MVEDVSSSSADKENTDIEKAKSHATSVHIPHTIFSLNEIRFMVFILTFAAIFSPISSTIYYPALGSVAEELQVSDTLVNLTITTFMIFQGLAPAFIGAFADAEGRRPAYLICFLVYIAANIGLALQSNYAALLVLRCVQSSGSSGTVALASAVVADISTPSERGRWMGWANAGALLGPAIGPIIGGVLAQYLGWRSIFWFLTIFAGVYLIPILLFFPESCRAVVGNGSHRPPKWNSCLLDPSLQKRIDADPSIVGPPIPPHSLRFPNPIKTLAVLFEKEAGMILISTGILFAGYYGLMAGLPSQLEANYGFDSLHIGLCFIASGAGGSIAALVTGRLMDYNFRRHARKLGLDASDTRRLRTLSSFPIEAARIEIALPFILLGAATMLVFGWVMRFKTNLSGPIILLFFIGACTTGAFTILASLTVDLFPEKPATATAASNMTRCWLGAAATAIVVPMVNALGTGWTYTIVAGLWLALCPALWIVIKVGPRWRREKEERAKEREAR